MAMEHFSWSDSIQAAFAPCLACLRHQPPRLDESDDEAQHQHGQHARIPRARPDELEGLLADSDDAETLSLHSNPGDWDRRRRKRRKQPRGITLFGFDLFGKPPIHLTDDEEESTSALGPSSSRRTRGAPQSRPRPNDERSRTISTDTLDSDAAPLDPATIDQLSAARLAESVQREEEERRLKDERRKLRKERKELKKAALQLALAQAEANGGAGFEGFQGSNPGYGHIPSPFMQYSTDGSDLSSPFPQDEFGAFQQGQPFPDILSIDRRDSEEADMDGADFGAENYARRPQGGSSTGVGSDSRSGTSASASNADSSRYNHHYMSQQHLRRSPLAPQDQYADAMPPRKKKSRKSARHSISTTSQSTAPVSPPPHEQTFAPQPMIAAGDAGYEYQHPGIVPENAVPDKASGFPSTGLRGGARRQNSEAGVFLAHRGDS